MISIFAAAINFNLILPEQKRETCFFMLVFFQYTLDTRLDGVYECKYVCNGVSIRYGCVYAYMVGMVANWLAHILMEIGG